MDSIDKCIAMRRRRYQCIRIYIHRERERESYKITHLLGKPQGPLLFSPEAVVGFPSDSFTWGVEVFSPLPVDINGPSFVVMLAAAASVGSVVGCDAAAAPAPPSSHWNALATTP